MLIKRSLILLTAVIVLGLNVAGCSGGDSGSGAAAVDSNGQTASGPGADTPGGAGNGAMASSSDAFFSQVLALISDSPNNTEPIEIHSIAVTTPENTEPASL